MKEAAGAIFTPGGFFDSEGEKIGNKFAPKFISSTLPGQLESLNYVDGHRPRGPTEASIDKAAAKTAGLEIGEEIELIGQGNAGNSSLSASPSSAAPPSAAPASPRSRCRSPSS